MRIVAILAIIIAGLHVLIVNSTFPEIGHDFRYLIPRLLDTHLFYQKNGIMIEWWTPYFGGGLPSYPNPNQMQFSIIQFLTLFFNPYKAVLITMFLLSVTAFYASYFLFKDIFNLEKTTSLLGATLFCCSGFFIEYTLTGNICYGAYELLPLFFYLILKKDNNLILTSVLIGFVLFFNLMLCGLYLMVVFPSSAVLMILIYLLVYRPKFSISFFRQVIKLGLGLILFVAMGSSKIYAVQSLMKFYPREMYFEFDVNIVNAYFGFLLQFFGVQLGILLTDAISLTKLFININGSQNQWLWNFDFGFSPVILVIVVIIFIKLFQNPSSFKFNLSVDRILYLLAFVIFSFFWITIITTKGPFYKEIKSLPFFKSLSDPFRLSGIFTLPILIVILVFWNKLKLNIKSYHRFNNAFVVISVIIFAYTYLYLANFYIKKLEWLPRFNPKVSIKAWKDINKNPEAFKVNSIERIIDTYNVPYNASSAYVYEPLFGDGNKFFTPKIHFGPVTDIDSGYYNVTHPASLNYFDENNLKRFERVKTNDKENFDKFVNHKPTNWKISQMQIQLNNVSFYSFIICVAIAIIFLGLEASTMIFKNKTKVSTSLSK